MKKKWIALMIMVASLCFTCACGGGEEETSSDVGSQVTASESMTDETSSKVEASSESETNTASSEQESASSEESSKEESSSEEESGVNGGSMAGDNDLDWNTPQN